MRRLIVTLAASLDGRHSGEDGDLSVMPFDAGFSLYNVERLREAGTLLLGRISYEGFLSYWPRVADDEAELPVEREISRLNSAIEKVVISDTLTGERTEPWTSTTRILPRRDAIEAVRTLKADGAGGDILVFGSATMWNALAEAGLVDELHVMVGPALVGSGPSLHEGARIGLRLREARRLDDSELVLLRYDVVG